MTDAEYQWFTTHIKHLHRSSQVRILDGFAYLGFWQRLNKMIQCNPLARNIRKSSFFACNISIFSRNNFDDPFEHQQKISKNIIDLKKQ
jgi:hypothetical protein